MPTRSLPKAFESKIIARGRVCGRGCETFPGRLPVRKAGGSPGPAGLCAAQPCETAPARAVRLRASDQIVSLSADDLDVDHVARAIEGRVAFGQEHRRVD